MAYRKPEPILSSHDLSAFDCGNEAMNEWLQKWALRNETSGATRTFVLCEDDGNQVIGFYGVTVGTIRRGALRGKHRHGMPNDIPVALLGRLAVDRGRQGQGLAKALVCEAARTAILASRHAGIAVIAVQAKDRAVAGFYEGLGFTQSNHDPLLYFLRLADVAATFPELAD
jgi:GNAT superfamily N-acetyltransferase